MKTFNLTSSEFATAMNTAIKSNSGSDTIEKDCVVKLEKVIRYNEDDEEKTPSIIVVYSDENAEQISDYRNFSGKTAENLGKQLGAHNLTLGKLGADLSNISADLAFLQDEEVSGEDKSQRLFNYYVSKFESVKGKIIGIEVEYDSEGSRYCISKYVKPSDIKANEEVVVVSSVEEGDLPF